MQLGELFPGATLGLTEAVIDVTRVSIDSRDCVAGTVFFAMVGATQDGHDYIEAAVERGAVAIVASRSVSAHVPVIRVEESAVREELARVSDVVAGQPTRDVTLVGVTGTNGKTSVTTILAQLIRACGGEGAVVGTLTNSHTTPPPPEFFRTVAALRDQFGAGSPRIIAAEISSHALDQRRVAGHYRIAAFTNLSHDHLDYHGDMAGYFAAKASFFSAHYADEAVVWVDDDAGARIASETLLPVTPVRASDARDVAYSLTSTVFVWRDQLVSTRLVGGYNVENILMAMTIAERLGLHPTDIATGMAQVEPVPGRMEVITTSPCTVVVDYAHTPDGLEHLLHNVRSLTTGRVIVIMGCGGDRDRSKRPVMGRVASTLADCSIITSDNPRHEEPDAIIDEVFAGCVDRDQVSRVTDRRSAIRQGLALARPDDTLVIAGKGHENLQVFADRSEPFDDRVVTREIVKEMTC